MYVPLAGNGNYDGKFKEIQPFYPSDAPDTVIHRALVSTKGRLDYESDTTHSDLLRTQAHPQCGQCPVFAPT